jgi:CheY-like chemotaxis protein
MNQVKRILLVEDNPNDIELTLMALAEHNLANEVVVTRDGEQALDYLHRRGSFENREEGNPTVVLLDLKMPKVDGLSVLREVRSDPTLKLIPMVLLTSSEEESDIAEGYNLGVNAYVVKPVDFHEFVDAVKKVGLFWSVTNVAPRPPAVAGPSLDPLLTRNRE